MSYTKLPFTDVATFEKYVRTELNPKKAYCLKDDGKLELNFNNKKAAEGTLIYGYDLVKTVVHVWWLTDRPMAKIKKGSDGSVYCKKTHLETIQKEFIGQNVRIHDVGHDIICVMFRLATKKIPTS